MIDIKIVYKDGEREQNITASYTKVRGSFFCIHFEKKEDGSGKTVYPNKFIPADRIKYVEQVTDKQQSDVRDMGD